MPDLETRVDILGASIRNMDTMYEKCNYVCS